MLFNQKTLAICLATAGSVVARTGHRYAAGAAGLSKRQGYIPECTYTIDAIAGDTCQTLADFATITLEQFKSYNPQVTDCNALIVGNVYCLEKNYGQPDPEPTSKSSAKPSSITSNPVTTKASSTQANTPTTTKVSGTPAPGPTQPGVAENCNRWDLIQSGNTCDTFTQKYGITRAQLVSWNPDIGTACTNMWVEYYICTSVEGLSAGTTAQTTAKPTSTSIAGAVPAPGPTQDGAAANCNRWDLVNSGNTCTTFTAKYPGLTIANLAAWNPAIGSACTNLWVEYYICTSIVGFNPTTTAAVTSKATTTKPATTLVSGAVAAPGPTQDGAATNCNRWDLVKSGNTCTTFTAKYPGVTIANLASWNPAIGASCTNLWVEYYICTSVVGFKPATSTTVKVTTTATPSATLPSGAVAAPGPTQEGAVKNCNRWDLVKSGNICTTFTTKYPGLSVANLAAWNPAIGAACTNLWVETYLCTSIVGFKPSTTVQTSTKASTPTSSVPSPVQSGINSKCTKYHLVKSGDTCDKLASTYKITVANFYKWNPAVGSTCASLWVAYYVCVAA